MENKRKNESATDVQDELKGMASGVKEAADEAKAKGLDHVAGVGRAVHGAADELGRELPQAAGYIHSVADRLESASSALRERSVEDLASSFNDFARRQPAAAFAGSVLAGFALSRFLKSSAPRPQSRR
jgi:predicted Zn-dependent protease